MQADVEGLQLQLRGSIDTWNRWALITLWSYYTEFWKDTRTGVDALFMSAIAVDGLHVTVGHQGKVELLEVIKK